MSKSVMGIDTSTNSLAFSIFDCSGRLIEWGEISFGGKTVTDRIVTGAKVIRELRDTHGRFDVDFVCAEQTVYVQNKSAVISLAYALGMTLGAIGNENVVQMVPVAWQSAINNPLLTKAEKDQIKKDNPTRSTSWLSSKRREIRKDRTRQWVKSRFGLEIESDNVTDAIAIGYVGWGKVNDVNS